MKPPLTIESFRGKEFNFHINRGVSAFRIDHAAMDKVELDFDVYLPTKGMNLQRPFVWSLLQKQDLIISLFKGIKLPPITLIEFQNDNMEDKRKYQVIDGKQRLNAMIEFCRGQFAIEWEGVQYYFIDLPDRLQKEILWYYPVADVGYHWEQEPVSDTDKIRWFELINFSGTPQDAEHIKNLKNAK